MIEVFKTNVTEYLIARSLTELIRLQFDGYSASFDLEDCDKVLRVQSENDRILSGRIITLLKKWGFQAEILPHTHQIMLQNEARFNQIMD